MCKLDALSLQQIGDAQGRGGSKSKECKALGCSVNLMALGKPYLVKKGLCKQHIQADAIRMKDAEPDSLWRFCQQCGKVEPLSRFEGKKRSCRIGLCKKRLTDKKSQHKTSMSNKQSIFAVGLEAHENSSSCNEKADGFGFGAPPCIMGTTDILAAAQQQPPLPTQGASAPAGTATWNAGQDVQQTHLPSALNCTANGSSGFTDRLASLTAELDCPLLDDDLEHFIDQQLNQAAAAASTAATTAAGSQVLQQSSAVASAAPATVQPHSSTAAVDVIDQQLQLIEQQLLADIAATSVHSSGIGHAVSANVAQLQNAAMQSLPPASFSCCSQNLPTTAVPSGVPKPANVSAVVAAKAALLQKLQLLAQECELLKAALMQAQQSTGASVAATDTVAAAVAAGQALAAPAGVYTAILEGCNHGSMAMQWQQQQMSLLNCSSAMGAGILTKP